MFWEKYWSVVYYYRFLCSFIVNAYMVVRVMTHTNTFAFANYNGVEYARLCHARMTPFAIADGELRCSGVPCKGVGSISSLLVVIIIAFVFIYSKFSICTWIDPYLPLSIGFF